MTESEVVTSPPVQPTDAEYLGCYADMVSDRVMPTVLTTTDLTPEVIKPKSCEVEHFAKILLTSFCTLCWRITRLAVSSQGKRAGEHTVQ